MSEDVGRWKQLLKEGKQIEADALKREIFEKTKERFRKENRGKWDIEILTVGNTPEPLILSILALKPKRCVFICTKQSRATLDTVARECGIEPSRITVEEIESKANAEDVYEVIQRTYTREMKICVDITGGTKAMVGGAAMAGGLLRLPLFYVNAGREFIDGRPFEVPDSEELVELKNPIEFFKTVEEAIGMELLDAHAYSAATTVLGKCVGTVRDSQRAVEFVAKKDIACAYLEWDSFNYREAAEHLQNALNQINRFDIAWRGRTILAQQMSVVERIAGALRSENLMKLLGSSDTAFPLIVDMFLNAERRYEQGQFGDGILRLYRTLEFITQYELVKHGISPDNVTPEVRKEFGRTFSENARIVYGAGREIPQKLSLMDSAILLLCLKEKGKDTVLWGPMAGPDDLQGFQNNLWPRNMSIVVHGFRASSENDYIHLKNFVFGYLERLIGEERLNKLMELLRHRTSRELFD